MNFPSSGAVSSCNERHYWESSPQQHYFQWIKADSHILLRTHPTPAETALNVLLGREAGAGRAQLFNYGCLTSSCSSAPDFLLSGGGEKLRASASPDWPCRVHTCHLQCSYGDLCPHPAIKSSRRERGHFRRTPSQEKRCLPLMQHNQR